MRRNGRIIGSEIGRVVRSLLGTDIGADVIDAHLFVAVISFGIENGRAHALDAARRKNDISRDVSVSELLAVVVEIERQAESFVEVNAHLIRIEFNGVGMVSV